MSKVDREYKTQSVFFFGDIRLAHQIADNGWGGFSHRIAALAGDLETVHCHGRSSVYQHPALIDHSGRTFIVMTSYYEDDTSTKPEVIYQLVPPPDSDAALKSVEARAQMIMKDNTKTELAGVLGICPGDISGTPKKEFAERVIRLKDQLEALGAR